MPTFVKKTLLQNQSIPLELLNPVRAPVRAPKASTLQSALYLCFLKQCYLCLLLQGAPRNISAMQSQLLDFPIDVLIKIVSNLPSEELPDLRKVCLIFRDAIAHAPIKLRPKEQIQTPRIRVLLSRSVPHYTSERFL